MKLLTKNTLAIAALSVLSFLLQSCSSSNAPTEPNKSAQSSGAATHASSASEKPSANRGSPNAAAISVSSVAAVMRDYPMTVRAVGTVIPISTVDVKPQMSSVVTDVKVREGQFVKKGDWLFSLDSRSDAANVSKAEAQLAKDQATLQDAARQLARSKELLEKRFVSQSVVDSNQAAFDAQQAVVTADYAAISAARVPLSYARIPAPGAGRIGTVNVVVGSSVQANTTTLLTITQLDPIAVGFNLPQASLQAALTAMQNGGARVTATIPNGGGTLEGHLQFVDNAIDASSGAVKVKAYFADRDNKLWPGAFVNVSMTTQLLKNAVVIPKAAIIESANGGMVYVIDQTNHAESRPIKMKYAEGEEAVIEGVRAGERVVLEGRQNVRPGAILAERAVTSPRSASDVGAPASAASTTTARTDAHADALANTKRGAL